MQITKSSLAIELSKLKVFENANAKLEQYPTDSEIASDVLWLAYMKGNIEGKIVADLGCGTGILGIGALHLGAKKVYFVDKDEDALMILQDNLAGIDSELYEIFDMDITSFDKQTDTVIQNPPFGTNEKHIDKVFLERAFEISDSVYSFHKSSTSKFIRKFSEDNDFGTEEELKYRFPLKHAMSFHKKTKKDIEVSIFILKRLK